MTISIKFEPIMKCKGVFTGMGEYIVSINGKLARVEIFDDGDVRFMAWLNNATLLSNEELDFFAKFGDKMFSK